MQFDKVLKVKASLHFCYGPWLICKFLTVFFSELGQYFFFIPFPSYFSFPFSSLCLYLSFYEFFQAFKNTRITLYSVLLE